MHSKQTIQQAEQKKRAIVVMVTERWKSKRVTSWKDISLEMGVSRGSMPRMLQELQQLKLIACVGTALDAGRHDLRDTVKVYAPYGVKVLSHVPLPREPKPPKYKGVKTPPHYSDWRTPEITRESYDIYAGRNLAMLAR